MTDSTTTAGWLKKTNFQESKSEPPAMTKAKLQIARGHASQLLSAQCVDFSQWFLGESNEIADSLFQDFHISDNELIHLFHSLFPQKTPKNLKISPLPQEIDSFLSSLLETLPGNL